MDDRKLREYAIKIYKGENDYSLQKAFRLFPKYYPKIAFFYTELLVQKQEELTRRTIQALGINKAVEMREIVKDVNKKINTFRTKTINDFKDLNEYKKFILNFGDKNITKFLLPGVRKKEKKILTDINNIGLALSESFRSVLEIANYYGFSDIFKEAARGLVDSYDLISELRDAISNVKEL